jgi:hypothetical protein
MEAWGEIMQLRVTHSLMLIFLLPFYKLFMKLDLHWVGDRRTSPSPLQIQSFEEQSQ